MLSSLPKTFGHRSSRRKKAQNSHAILAIESLNARFVLSAVMAIGDSASVSTQPVEESLTGFQTPDETSALSTSEVVEHMYPEDSEASYPDMSSTSMPSMMMVMSDFSLPTNQVSQEELQVMHELFANDIAGPN